MKRNWTDGMARCPTCDEWYDEGGERASIHEHPEPQSGAPRDAWIASGLAYDEWVELTTEGMAWLEWRKARGFEK